MSIFRTVSLLHSWNENDDLPWSFCYFDIPTIYENICRLYWPLKHFYWWILNHTKCFEECFSFHVQTIICIGQISLFHFIVIIQPPTSAGTWCLIVSPLWFALTWVMPLCHLASLIHGFPKQEFSKKLE